MPALSLARRPAWWPAWSRPAALRTLRAVLVVPALFALTFEGFGNLQMALFAAFGGFAHLVMASFGGTRRDKLIAHLSGPPPKVTAAVTGIPAAFDEVIATAMAIRPEDRFQSAGELGAAAIEAARLAGPEPPDPVPFPTESRAVDADAPTAG